MKVPWGIWRFTFLRTSGDPGAKLKLTFSNSTSPCTGGRGMLALSAGLDSSGVSTTSASRSNDTLSSWMFCQIEERRSSG